MDMSDEDKQSNQKHVEEQRAKRRSEQLRANLMRRKAQIRSRRAGAADERDEGLQAVKPLNTDAKIVDD